METLQPFIIYPRLTPSNTMADSLRIYSVVPWLIAYGAVSQVGFTWYFVHIPRPRRGHPSFLLHIQDTLLVYVFAIMYIYVYCCCHLSCHLSCHMSSVICHLSCHLSCPVVLIGLWFMLSIYSSIYPFQTNASIIEVISSSFSDTMKCTCMCMCGSIPPKLIFSVNRPTERPLVSISDQ